MPTDDNSSGFLSRWSRRKAQVRQAGVADAPDVAAVSAVAPTVALAISPLEATAQQPLVTGAPLPASAQAYEARDSVQAETAPAAPTLADVAALTRDSDYSRFMARSVQPDVKNAALGKLFTDPHFNVMDGLDVYIDDYGQPDPLPPGMLRQMLQAHVLGLFDEEDDKKAEPAGSTEVADTAAPPNCADTPPTEALADENTDLQLQPDDGAGRAGPEPGAGENAGCPH